MIRKKLRNSLFIKILTQSFYVYQQRFFMFYLISAVPVIVGFIINKYFFENDILIRNLIRSTSHEMFYFIDYNVSIFLLVVIIIYLAALIKYIHSVGEERSSGVFSAYKEAIADCKNLLWTVMVCAWHVLIRLLLLIIPGILAAVNYSLAPVIVLVEGKTGKEAMEQSLKYVKRGFNNYLDPLFFMSLWIGAYCFIIIYFLDNLAVFVYYKFQINISIFANFFEWFVVLNGVCFLVTFYYLLYKKIKEGA